MQRKGPNFHVSSWDSKMKEVWTGCQKHMYSMQWQVFEQFDSS